ncbi:ATP synthase E chain-domain-containing protein [Jimgerdemannia flammicorona]|uniref:ATP synthase F(0) complex subunit e, mitochondrial n=1 Tax=Jimgerdemannia flammicorona TaxID=994334 RepID=A0A433QM77_9FUNG|nr:ATP synthase E chain-domain-containing protein [Jimgerdemannia flammicorona]
MASAVRNVGTHRTHPPLVFPQPDPHTNAPKPQVARWSALGLGLVYGFWHNSSLHKAIPVKEAQHVYNHKVDLINQAKAAYAKKQPTSGGSRSLLLFRYIHCDLSAVALVI